MTNKLQFIILLLTACMQIELWAQSEIKIKDKKTDIYIQALRDTKERSKLEKFLLEEIERETRVNRLFFFTRTASDVGLLAAADKGYEKLLVLSPNTPSFIKEMAVISLRKSQFTRTAAYLNDFHSKEEGDLDSHFYHAEALYWLKEFDEAHEHYEKALKLSRRQVLPKIDHQMYRPRILSRLHWHDLSLRKMRLLYRKNMENPAVAIQYIDILLENDMPEKAMEIYQAFLKKIRLDDFEKETVMQIRLVKIRLLNDNLKPDKALDLNDALLEDYPDAPGLLSLKAALYNNRLRWRREKELLLKLKELDPINEDITRRYNRVDRWHRSFTDLMAYARFSDEGDSELVLRHQSQKRFDDFWSIGVINEVDFAKIDESFDENGIVDDLNGQEINSELYLLMDFLNGGEMKLSLFVPHDSSSLENTGLGLLHKVALKTGQFHYGAEYRRPYFGVAEGILHGLVRDRVFANRIWQYSNKLQLSLGVGLNRYGIRHVYNTGESISLQPAISYRLTHAHWQYKLFGDESTIYLNYFIDYEDFKRVTKRLNINNVEYEPIGHEDREVHVVNALLFQQFDLRHSLETYLGYAYDRKSYDHGPVLGWLYRYRTPHHFELRIFGSHSLTTAIFTTIGIGARWDF